MQDKERRGRNVSTVPNPPLTSSVPDRASSWALAPMGCFTYIRTTELVEIGAPVVEFGSASPLHGITLREHHTVASPLWPSSYGILIFLSILVSDADAMRRFCAVAARPSVGPSHADTQVL